MYKKYAKGAPSKGKAGARAYERVHGIEPPAPMTVEEVCTAARAEGLVLHAVDGSLTGYRCVYFDEAAGCRPFRVRIKDGSSKQLGSFSTAEEAALCYARHVSANNIALPKNASKKRKITAYSPGQNSMSAADALASARDEGLMLQTAPNTASGFAGVKHDARGYLRPYACVCGSFQTAEEAALAIARKRASSSRSSQGDEIVILSGTKLDSSPLASNLTLAVVPPITGYPEPHVSQEQVFHVNAVEDHDGSDGDDGMVATETGSCSCCTAIEHRIRVIEMKIAAAQRLNDAELTATLKQQLVDL